jgi:hypothetical protein
MGANTMEAGQEVKTVPGESTPGAGEKPAAEAGAEVPAPEGEKVGAEEHETLEGHTLTPEAQAAFDRRVGQLTAARRSAEERAEAAEAEAKVLKEQLADAGRNAESDRATMAAAERAGVLPALVSANDIRLLEQARNLRGWRDFYEGLLDGENPAYEGRDETGRDVKLSAGDIRRRAREMGRALEGMQGRELAILENAPKRLKALMELGQAAEKAGWKPGTAAAPRPAPKPAAAVPGEAPRKLTPAAAPASDGNPWALYAAGKITREELHERLGRDALARSPAK